MNAISSALFTIFVVAVFLGSCSPSGYQVTEYSWDESRKTGRFTVVTVPSSDHTFVGESECNNEKDFNRDSQIYEGQVGMKLRLPISEGAKVVPKSVSCDGSSTTITLVDGSSCKNRKLTITGPKAGDMCRSYKDKIPVK